MEVNYLALLTFLSGLVAGFALGLHEGIRVCRKVAVESAGACVKAFLGHMEGVVEKNKG